MLHYIIYAYRFLFKAFTLIQIFICLCHYKNCYNGTSLQCRIKWECNLSRLKRSIVLSKYNNTYDLSKIGFLKIGYFKVRIITITLSKISVYSCRCCCDSCCFILIYSCIGIILRYI